MQFHRAKVELVDRIHAPHEYSPSKFVHKYRVPVFANSFSTLGPQSVYAGEELKDPSHGYGYMGMIGIGGVSTLRGWMERFSEIDLMDIRRDIWRHTL